MFDSDWARDQDFSEAEIGDDIFDIVKRGAGDIESSWASQNRPWFKLFQRSVQGWLLAALGYEEGIQQYLKVLFDGERSWPRGLSNKEKAILKTAVAASGYIQLPKSMRSRDGEAPSDDKVLAVFKDFAKRYEKQILMPMYATYYDANKNRAMQILPLCRNLDPDCTLEDAEQIFRGDLERGWKLGTLGFGYATQRVFPSFVKWLML